MTSQGKSAGAVDVLALPGIRRGRPTLLARVVRTARRKPLGVVAAFVLLVLVLAAVFADTVAIHNPIATSRDVLRPPSAEHFFGTDNLGRDVWSRIIYGSRVSLYVGVLAVVFGTLAGALIGLVSGYFEGKFDLLVQRVMDAFLAFPSLILAMALVAVLGPSTENGMLAIAVTILPGDARVVRGTVLSVKQNMYVEAARALGASNTRILFRHILPNVLAPVLILVSVWLGNAILIESSLSFLGLGTQPPEPSWGTMLSGNGRRYLEQGPWLAIFPGLAISVTVFAMNLLGDTIRDLMDPKLRGR